MKSFNESALLSIDDAALEDVAGAGLLTGNNSFALIDLSNLLGLGNVALLGDGSSKTTTTTTNTAPKGLLGLGGLLGVL